MSKTTYQLIKGFLIATGLFFAMELWLGWLDEKCWFRHDASFFENLKQYLSHVWAVAFVVILLFSLVGIIVLSAVYHRQIKTREQDAPRSDNA